MKKILLAAFYLMFLTTMISPSHAQLQDAIEQLNGENTEGYLQPFANIFGASLNAGLFNTAHISRMGLDLQIGVVAMGTLIPDKDLTYKGKPPAPWPQNKVETASVFGGKGTVIQNAGMTYGFQNGQISGNFALLGIPHLEIGSVMGTKLKFRYFVYDFGESIGELSLLGYGLQHSVSQYIPLFPIDLSVQIFLQQFDVGDIISSNALFYGVQASKSLGPLTFYGGMSLHNTTLDVEYTYESENAPEETIGLSLKSNNNFWMTLGARMKLTVLILNADLSFGSTTTMTLGVGLGI